MNKEIRDKWLKALRSGSYKQGKGYLHRVKLDATNSEVHEYCCLGVLCEVAMAEGLELKLGYRNTLTIMYDNNPALLPQKVCGWAGLTEDTDVVEHLMKSNDAGVPFTMIADYIEETL